MILDEIEMINQQLWEIGKSTDNTSFVGDDRAASKFYVLMKRKRLLLVLLGE